jgi:N-acetyl sugar amidotransferase
MSEKVYQICTRCVMDTSDPDIVFDGNGVCNHCTGAIEQLKQPPYGLPPKEKEAALQQLIADVKKAGKGKKYDCIIGLSGGVDSSYLAYLVKQWGLHPLAIHVDNGWDSEQSVRNIENICKILDIDLYTNVLNWEEFKDLQLAFLKASTPDSEIPTDNILTEVLYQVAKKYKAKYILSGCNSSSESILPKAWSQGHHDSVYIRGLYKAFGKKRKLKTLPILSRIKIVYYHNIRKIHWINTLDYIHYDKEKVKIFLKEHIKWQDYGRKHGESTYTRIFQEYILPKKFGYDKRRAHYSSLIAAGQLSREKALEMLKQPLYENEVDVNNDIVYLCNKFGISKVDFERILQESPKTIKDYPNTYSSLLYKVLRAIESVAKKWIK